jgi:hypothetical protein
MVIVGIWVDLPFVGIGRGEMHMDSYNTLLNKIRERPVLYLGKKSLAFLTSFMHGFEEGVYVGTWEASTALGFYENYQKAITSKLLVSQVPDYSRTHHLFNEFVHTHYSNVSGTFIPYAAKSAAYLISEMSNSEEEAFDTYFELHDEFLKQMFTSATLAKNE